MINRKKCPIKFESLFALHRILGLPSPSHPLVSVVENTDESARAQELPETFNLGFYKISYFANPSGRYRYGQSVHDFNEGGMFFMSPNQIISRYTADGDKGVIRYLFTRISCYLIPSPQKSDNTFFFLQR